MVERHAGRTWREDVCQIWVSPTEEFIQKVSDLHLRLINVKHRHGVSEAQLNKEVSVFGCNSYQGDYLDAMLSNCHVPQDLFVHFWQNVSGLEQVIDGLERVMKKEFILTWLTTPNPAFENKEPRELLSTQEGVEKILTMIEEMESCQPI